MILPVIAHIRLILGRFVQLQQLNSTTDLLVLVAEEQESMQLEGEGQSRRVLEFKGWIKTDLPNVRAP